MTDAPHVADRTGTRTDDVDAIRAIVADVEAGFNDNDATLMTRHFAADAVAVEADGVALTGLVEIRSFHETAVAGVLRDQHVRYDVVDVAFLGPDTALARKRAVAVDRAGEPIALDHTMCALHVLVRDHDRWWIAARQNTIVPR